MARLGDGLADYWGPFPAASAIGDTEAGLYRKYNVERLNDLTGKHADCLYYVLDLVHDQYAAVALKAYADACEDEYPQLAADLRSLFEGTTA